MKLSARIQINSIFILVIILGVGLLQHISVKSLKKIEEQSILTTKISNGAFELNIIAHDYLKSHSKRAQNQWQRRHISLSKLIDGLQFKFDDRQEFVESLQNYQDILGTIFSKLQNNYQDPDNQANARAFSKELEDRLGGQLLMYTQNIVSKAAQLEEKIHQELRDNNNKVSVNVIRLITLLLIMTSAFNFFLVRKIITKPLENLLVGINKLGRGDLETRVAIDAQDEIGSLSRAFDQMATNLESVTVTRDELTKEVNERRRAEEDLRKTTRYLNERVKELNCLYGISELIEKKDTLEEIFQGTADIIPSSWQYPEITCAQIKLDGQSHRTKTFKETEWQLSQEIIIHGEKVGAVEIYYLEEKPESDEGPFLTEERLLVNAIAERLGHIVDRKQATNELKKLRGIVPICSYCKEIRDDKGFWNRVEAYIEENTEAQLSHGICPDCVKKYYPDIVNKNKVKKKRA